MKKVTPKNKDPANEKFSQKHILYLLVLFFVITISLFIFYPKNGFLPYRERLFLVTNVIDGDTFEIETGQRIRLICLDTPEEGQEGYENAKSFLEHLILNKNIRLEIDVTNKDDYGRLLRYAYLQEDGELGEIFVNKQIVKQGYGEIMIVKPNTKYCDRIAGDIAAN